MKAAQIELAFEGSVDSISPRFITGWCWFPERPDLVAELRVRVGNAIITTARADLYRKDVAEAGKRGGLCRFDIPLPSLWQTRARSLRVELADGRPLPNGEIEIPPSLVRHEDSDDLWPLRLIGVHGYLESFGPNISGWIAPPRGVAAVHLSFCEGDQVLFRLDAAEWRADLEDSYDGDGRGGFDLPVPPILRDGKEHRIDIRANAQSLLYEPLCVRFDAIPAKDIISPSVAPSFIPKLVAAAKAVTDFVKPVDFTFVINFYNMRREAERTLTSLTRAYQRDAEDIRYEVICVDNGSNPPLDEDWVRSFGPEFRLFRPSKILPSPCFALNEAARQARGRHVAAMIDGAHILSPGVLREAQMAIKEDRDTVVALRQWFFGGDQRWLNQVGYTREQEDILFGRVGWPSDGYRLFEVSVPMTESPNDWFDGIQESNCLFVPVGLWNEKGGFDEAFSIPGGGFCNLDLLRRAADSGHTVTVLMGEATFHQYHEGTTTNVDDQEKENRVRSYSNTYRQLRGKDFLALPCGQFRVRGRVRSAKMYALRQRPPFNGPLGITTRIRPLGFDRRIDDGLLLSVNSAYVESGLQNLTRWRGEPISLAPGDLIALQNILHSTRPERIVLTAREVPLIRFLGDMLSLVGIPDTRLVCVVDEMPSDPEAHVDYVVGPPYAPSTLDMVETSIGLAESVLVLFSRRPEDFLPAAEICAYMRFVSFGSYLVVLRTVLGQPWLGYSKYRLKRAIELSLSESDFVIDESFTQSLASVCLGGFLARVKAPLPRAGDEALDQLAS